MRSLQAHIAIPAETVDRRRTQRRTLRLDAAVQSADQQSSVIIRNLSRTGLLIETDAPFDLGETFILILPEVGATPARIVRVEGRLYGCEFHSPVPASAISAAQLKSTYDDGQTSPDAEQLNAMQMAMDSVEDRRGAHPVLLTALTILFTAALLLFIVALSALNISPA